MRVSARGCAVRWVAAEEGVVFLPALADKGKTIVKVTSGGTITLFPVLGWQRPTTFNECGPETVDIVSSVLMFARCKA
jgi:hypothetical protein